MGGLTLTLDVLGHLSPLCCLMVERVLGGHWGLLLAPGQTCSPRACGCP